MAFLPTRALTLTGGCFCSAIRYTIGIPELRERSLVPGALKTPISSKDSIQTRVPVVDIDHCDTCRRVSGAIVQCWIICPVNWVEWDLLVQIPSESENTQGTWISLSTVDAVSTVHSTNRTVEETFLTRFNASDHATRTFCSRCGTNLTYISHTSQADESVVDITVGSLDVESLKLVQPDRHGWWDSGVYWIKKLLSAGDGGFLIRHATRDLSEEVRSSV